MTGYFSFSFTARTFALCPPILRLIYVSPVIPCAVNFATVLVFIGVVFKTLMVTCTCSELLGFISSTFTFPTLIPLYFTGASMFKPSTDSSKYIVYFFTSLESSGFISQYVKASIKLIATITKIPTIV